ncbi:MAG TPA: M23 family metallopeptidase [Micromonosporaceae bacterium]|nr:M23 family metallopeptidase [Micromonosporaceae bacterium]
MIASVGAALLGFGLAGVSAAGPMQSEPGNRAAAAGATFTTPSAPADPAAAAQAEAAARADATAAAARAAAARRPDRASRSPSAPAPTKTASPRPTAKPAPTWVHPMPDAEVTSCYGTRWGTLHAGIDLADPVDTPIRAVADGIVESAGWVQAGYGISVLIDHGNGYLTHYGHLNREAVRPGEKVEAGEVIGYEGSTGDSTGPHLHFEVHRGAWNQIDPAPWMRSRGVDLGC